MKKITKFVLCCSCEYSKCSKFSETFLSLFSNKMLAIRAVIHKMLARIANRDDPDQTASKKQFHLGLPCLSRPFGQATMVFKILEYLLLCCK